MDDTQFINVWMENAINETNRWALVRILIWDFDMDLPGASGKWG